LTASSLDYSPIDFGSAVTGCPCTLAITKEETQKTSLSSRVFRRSAWKHRFNERKGTFRWHPKKSDDYPEIILANI
jgi:hypothetical protein